MKRFLSMIFAVIMAFGCFAVAGSGTYVDDYSNKINLRSSYNAANYTSAYVCTKKVLKTSNGVTGTTTLTYNSKGFLTKESYKNTDGDAYTATYTYDSNGNLTKRVYKSCKENNSNSYTYNSSGNVSKLSYKGDGLWSVTKYTYASNGILKKADEDIGSTSTFPDCSYNTTFTNDSNGNRTKDTTLYKGSIDDHIYTYSYNSKGLLTKAVESNSTNYTYNSKGYLTKAGSTAYTYNSNGYVTKAGGTTFTYDSHGNLTKEKSSGYTTTYTYKKITTTSPVIAGNIHIQYASTKYTGKAKKPNVTVDNLQKGLDYRVTYSNNVKAGTAKAKIIFCGKYATQSPVTISYKIKAVSTKPTKVTGFKATKITANSVTLKWNKDPNATGYVVYNYNKTKKAYVKIGTTSKTTGTIKNLKSGNTYIFAVKSYKKSGSKTVYGKMSDKVTVTAKKASSSSSSSVTYYKVYDTGSAGLSLREGPGTDYDRIVVIPNDTKVKYLGSKKNGFLNISCTVDGKTYKGWASADYLKKV